MLLFRVKYEEGWSQWHPKPDAYSELGFYAIRQNSVEYLPAWSLHRLWCMLPKYIRIETYEYGRKYIAALDLELDAHLNVIYKEGVEEPCYDQYFFINDAYESVCRAIEWLIKEGYFPKEYLV